MARRIISAGYHLRDRARGAFLRSVSFRPVDGAWPPILVFSLYDQIARTIKDDLNAGSRYVLPIDILH